MSVVAERYSSIMEALGWTLLNSVWQACVLFLVASIVLRFMPSQLSRARYAVACGALAFMVVGSVATYFIVLQAAAPETPTVAIQMVNITTENPSEVLSNHSTLWQNGFRFLDANMTYILFGWSIGALLFSLRIISGWFFLKGVARDAIEIRDEWYEKLQTLAKNFDLNKAIRLAESARIHVPMVIGFMKPVVLIPAAMLSGLSPSQIETIFVHELAHIRRNDYIINLIQTILESIFFFNPFVWFLSGIIRREREYCCDDEVISRHGEVLVYAQALASLEEIRLQRVSLALSLAESKNLLFNRIKRIMEKSAKNSFGRERMIPALLLVIGMVCASWLTIRTDGEERYVASNEGSETETNEVALTEQDTIIKDNKSNSRITILRIDEDGNTHEQVFEEGVDMDDFDLAFEPIELDAIMDFQVPTVDLAVPGFPMRAPSPVLAPSFSLQPFSLPFDTIPGTMYYKSGVDEEWKEFSKEFAKKFREEFGDFYKKNEKEFGKMMKEMEVNFQKRYEEQQLAREQWQDAMRAQEEMMAVQQYARQEQEEAAHLMQKLRELEVVDRETVPPVIEAQRAMEAHAAAEHELAASMHELAAQAHEAEGNMKAFERSFRTMLIQDGYIKSTDEIKSFKREQNGKMEVNGIKIKDEHLEKYNDLHRKHFKPGFHYWNVE